MRLAEVRSRRPTSARAAPVFLLYFFLTKQKTPDSPNRTPPSIQKQSRGSSRCSEKHAHKMEREGKGEGGGDRGEENKNNVMLKNKPLQTAKLEFHKHIYDTEPEPARPERVLLPPKA